MVRSKEGWSKTPCMAHEFYEFLLTEKFLADMGGQEMLLPGLPFTPMQLFWIFHGQTWCSAIREETLRSNIINDYHSPARFRINVPLSNYAGFAKDFECKPSDQMVEAEPCRIWWKRHSRISCGSIHLRTSKLNVICCVFFERRLCFKSYENKLAIHWNFTRVFLYTQTVFLLNCLIFSSGTQF